MTGNKQEKAMALGPLRKFSFTLEVLCSPVHVANISNYYIIPNIIISMSEAQLRSM